MADGFDLSEMDKFTKDILAMANDKLPKESKKFIRKEGTSLRKVVVKVARSKVKKKSGNYFKGFKRGKAYNYKRALSIRVFNGSPHAHLIENGHRLISKNGEEVGFVPGVHVFDAATKKFENQFFNDVENFVGETISKLF